MSSLHYSQLLAEPSLKKVKKTAKNETDGFDHLDWRRILLSPLKRQVSITWMTTFNIVTPQAGQGILHAPKH
ncbi:MAG: hypothetical protein HOI15_16860 [Opitutales bacterium]|nr:hypothetical protein [Opitutales bacterium]